MSFYPSSRCLITKSIDYLGIHTGLTLLVLLMGHPLVQLAPKRIGLPAGDLRLQAAVESVMVCRVEVQASAEDVKSLESSFAGRGLNEVLEQLRHILLLRLPHRPRCGAMVWCAEAPARFSPFCQMWLHPLLGSHRHAQSAEERHSLMSSHGKDFNRQLQATRFFHTLWKKNWKLSLYW